MEIECYGDGNRLRVGIGSGPKSQINRTALSTAGFTKTTRSGSDWFRDSRKNGAISARRKSRA